MLHFTLQVRVGGAAVWHAHVWAPLCSWRGLCQARCLCMSARLHRYTSIFFLNLPVASLVAFYSSNIFVRASSLFLPVWILLSSTGKNNASMWYEHQSVSLVQIQLKILSHIFCIFHFFLLFLKFLFLEFFYSFRLTMWWSESHHVPFYAFLVIPLMETT